MVYKCFVLAGILLSKTIYNKMVDSPKNVKSLSVLSSGVGG